MQTTQLTIRIDEQLKNQVAAKAKKMGFNLSNLTRVIYTSFVNNDKTIAIDNEAVIDEALKSKEVQAKLVKLAEAVKNYHAKNNRHQNL